jgi:hypothetical protein
MSITINPQLETTLRSRAEAEGLSIEAYLESLVSADQEAERELVALALEGLNSGDPIEIGPGYWEKKHRRLDERSRVDPPVRGRPPGRPL